MKLAAGVAPVPQMRRAGVAVGLGTDGAASNDDVNMWEEMDTAAKLHKLIAKDPTVLNAHEAVEMATIGGARCLGLDDHIGSLTPGKRADLIMVSLLAPNMSVGPDPANLLVNSAAPANVERVVVDGRILKRDGKLTHVDVKRSLHEAAASLKAVRERANWPG